MVVVGVKTRAGNRVLNVDVMLANRSRGRGTAALQGGADNAFSAHQSARREFLTGERETVAFLFVLIPGRDTQGLGSNAAARVVPVADKVIVATIAVIDGHAANSDGFVARANVLVCVDEGATYQGVARKQGATRYLGNGSRNSPATIINLRYVVAAQGERGRIDAQRAKGNQRRYDVIAVLLTVKIANFGSDGVASDIFAAARIDRNRRRAVDFVHFHVVRVADRLPRDRDTLRQSIVEFGCARYRRRHAHRQRPQKYLEQRVGIARIEAPGLALAPNGINAPVSEGDELFQLRFGLARHAATVTTGDVTAATDSRRLRPPVVLIPGDGLGHSGLSKTHQATDKGPRSPRNITGGVGGGDVADVLSTHQAANGGIVSSRDRARGVSGTDAALFRMAHQAANLGIISPHNRAGSVGGSDAATFVLTSHQAAD